MKGAREMRLADWLETKGMTQEEFAARLGVDGSTITRLIPREGKRQTRKPSFDLAQKIARLTNGEVMPNDFMDADDGDAPPSGGGGSGGGEIQAASCG